MPCSSFLFLFVLVAILSPSIGRAHEGGKHWLTVLSAEESGTQGVHALWMIHPSDLNALLGDKAAPAVKDLRPADLTAAVAKYFHLSVEGSILAPRVLSIEQADKPLQEYVEAMVHFKPAKPFPKALTKLTAAFRFPKSGHPVPSIKVTCYDPSGQQTALTRLTRNKASADCVMVLQVK